MELSFSWDAEDTKNMDNISVQFVTHADPDKCFKEMKWECGTLDPQILRGDVLGLVKDRTLLATGLVCYIEDSTYRVLWTNKRINLEVPIHYQLDKKYSREDIKELNLYREVEKAVNRFMR